MSRGGAEREGDTESEAGCQHSSEPDAGLELRNCEIMTWTAVGRLTDWATQAPLIFSLKNNFYFYKLKITATADVGIY